MPTGERIQVERYHALEPGVKRVFIPAGLAWVGFCSAESARREQNQTLTGSVTLWWGGRPRPFSTSGKAGARVRFAWYEETVAVFSNVCTR